VPNSLNILKVYVLKAIALLDQLILYIFATKRVQVAHSFHPALEVYKCVELANYSTNYAVALLDQ